MRDLKIKPGMDTPKAKLKNPAPKDADSLLKQHMDKRQREKEPESRDPVRYATDRVEKNMRRGASGASCGRSRRQAAPPPEPIDPTDWIAADSWTGYFTTPQAGTTSSVTGAER